ncbi:MAG: transposase [Candidatus Caldatribacterium sp.]|nr:transposase [Candidatus Caldatribacterium sp.]
MPRVREGNFHPRILPYRKRASVDLSEVILTLYKEHLPLPGGRLRRLLLPAEHLPTPCGRRGTGEGLAGKAISGGVLRGVPGWDFPLHPPGKNGQGTGVHGPGD